MSMLRSVLDFAALMAGTPAVIIPTISEREGNARRVVVLGAGEVVIPTAGADTEKHVDAADFRAKVDRVLREPAYRSSAQRVANSMLQYGGSQAAADQTERFANESRRAVTAPKIIDSG
jgi:UDP:flavonoid glycosyltransferase YjiC (YdhE family)